MSKHDDGTKNAATGIQGGRKEEEERELFNQLQPSLSLSLSLSLSSRHSSTLALGIFESNKEPLRQGCNIAELHSSKGDSESNESQFGDFAPH